MKLTKTHKYLLYGVVALIVIAIVVSIVQNTGRAMAAKAAVKRSEETGFVPEPYASSINTDLNKGWSWSDPSAYTNVLALTDEEIRAVWEFYEVKYKPEKGTYQGKSMRTAIDSATFYGFAAGIASDALMKKLLELKLP